MRSVANDLIAKRRGARSASGTALLRDERYDAV